MSVRKKRDSSFKASIHSFTHSFKRGGSREWDEPAWGPSQWCIPEGEEERETEKGRERERGGREKA